MWEPLHDESSEYIERPFQTGMRNSTYALIPIVFALAVYEWRFRVVLVFANWWHFLVILSAVPAVCFAHAYLGHYIRRSTATNIFIVLLTLILGVGVYVLTR